MKNARHGEIYSVMNSTNNAFMAADKYPYKKKAKMAHAEAKTKQNLQGNQTLSFLQHNTMCCKHQC